MANTGAPGQRVRMLTGGTGVGKQGGSEPTASMPRLETRKQVTETGRATEQACQGGRRAQLSHTAYHCGGLARPGWRTIATYPSFDYLCWSPLADWDKDISLAMVEPDIKSSIK